MKILLIHHLEMMWESGYERFSTSFEEEAGKVLNFIRTSDFDKIILSRMEDIEPGEEHYASGLAEFIDEVNEYAYGWQREEFEADDPKGEGIRWANGCDHSEVVMLDDWIKDLKGHDVTLVGAFEHECIETLSTALDHCEVDYTREEGLIVGTGVTYTPRFSEDEVADRLIEDMEEAVAMATFDSLPALPDRKRIRESLDELLPGYTFAEMNELRAEMEGDLVEIYIEDTVSIRLDDLILDQDVFDDAEAISLKDWNENPRATFRAKLTEAGLVLNPEDYPLVYRCETVGIERVAVEVEAVELDLLDRAVISLDTEKAFKKAQTRLRHRAQESALSP